MYRAGGDHRAVDHGVYYMGALLWPSPTGLTGELFLPVPAGYVSDYRDETRELKIPNDQCHLFSSGINEDWDRAQEGHDWALAPVGQTPRLVTADLSALKVAIATGQTKLANADRYTIDSVQILRDAIDYGQSNLHDGGLSLTEWQDGADEATKAINQAINDLKLKSATPAKPTPKPAPAKPTPKPAPAKPAPAKKAPAKKTPTKKTPAKKTPAKKTPVKTPVKKAPVKKMPKKAPKPNVKAVRRHKKAAKRYRTVRRGDTLASISRKDHISVKRLCQLNHISRHTHLRAGRRLRIR